MKTTNYFSEDYISIDVDSKNSWIVADWKGYQTETSVKTGCEKILEALVESKYRQVLNDNTHVVGIWTPAAQWVGSNWFPRLIHSGLERFAWVYSPSILSQVSTEEAIKHAPYPMAIKTFYSIDLAREWLKS